jgi:hypothetical protein
MNICVAKISFTLAKSSLSVEVDDWFFIRVGSFEPAELGRNAIGTLVTTTEIGP